MRRTGRGWDPSFFCRFVKSALAFAFGAVMLSTDLLPWFDALPPFVGGTPCRLFIACGRPNQERSSLPVLTVLLLLTEEHQEEGEWVEKRGGLDLWSVGTPEVFLCLVFHVGISHPVSTQRSFECPFLSSGEGIGRSFRVVVEVVLLDVLDRRSAVIADGRNRNATL